jgi:hypothetical protein
VPQVILDQRDISFNGQQVRAGPAMPMRLDLPPSPTGRTLL